jgi:hypothetical protein
MDDFPLTRIDKIIDSAAGYEMMAHLDYFLGYHQIWLRSEDEEKNELYNTLRNLLLSENAQRLAQRRPDLLQNDEGSIKR